MMPEPNSTDPTSPEFFEALYRTSEDPWSFATDPYELFRYERIAAALADRSYGEAFEPACSVGVLTAMLAPRCGSLLAVDLSSSAVTRARSRCAPFGNVTVQVSGFEQVPPHAWDLMILSEIGYYFDAEQWRALLCERVAALQPGAVLLASHWLGHSEDHRMHGDEVHAILNQQHGLEFARAERHDHFRLDKWCKH